MAHLLGYDSPEEMRTYLTDIRQQLYVHPEDRDLIIADILNMEQCSDRSFSVTARTDK